MAVSLSLSYLGEFLPGRDFACKARPMVMGDDVHHSLLEIGYSSFPKGRGFPAAPLTPIARAAATGIGSLIMERFDGQTAISVRDRSVSLPKPGPCVHV
jgi:hypothetical protein